MLGCVVITESLAVLMLVVSVSACFVIVDKVEGVEPVKIVDVDCVVLISETEDEVASVLKTVIGVDFDEVLTCSLVRVLADSVAPVDVLVVVESLSVDSVVNVLAVVEIASCLAVLVIIVG